MKKTIIISSLALLLVVGVASAMTLTGTPQEIKDVVGETIDSPPEVNFGGFANAPFNIIGTRTGTSTSPVNIYGDNVASTTYPAFIGREINTATIEIGVINASSTSNVHISLLGSNDDECDTATSTTIYDQATVGQIKWYDLGEHLTNKVHSTSLAKATSTLIWDNPTAGTTREIVLENLHSQCVALEVNGSYIQLWSRITTKEN